MTNPTIPPQQPEPERVCGNCEFFKAGNPAEMRPKFGDCLAGVMPPCMKVRCMEPADTCVLFRAREES